ncbi:flagellar filament capping protein FliD [Blastomonas aquatica]|uniref:Flagellar hook-associated protein 2 n=1 Tax=Blastomonas aquatica TaxID=1510276 RepID=A0ABQ1IVM6_9SPHN|nr:flagellar filament capping protein FliD [Blastomonas aquatica]GGB52225.1 B-type flagellar hook-associated protein 2 [Blastomonas aquatica]
MVTNSGISNLITGFTGVNSASLVNDLVAASLEPKQAAVRDRQNLNQARISALASATSALDTFSTALTEILNGRQFSGSLVSTRGDLVAASFIPGQKPQGLPATVQVTQLASAQSMVSAASFAANAQVGEGTLTIATSTGSFNVVVDATNNSLGGLRDAINATDSGVTASIVTDNSGSRLVLRGKEGSANTFTVTGSGGGAALDAFAFPPAGGAGMTSVTAATDSIVNVNGIQVTNSSNQIDTAVPGVRINLLAASPGTNVVISGDQPTSSVKDVVNEFVKAYNSLRTALNDATAPGLDGASGGPLAGERAARDMMRAMASLTTTPLSDSGAYRALADIGISTGRDGTLTLNSAAFDRALAADPEGVARMLEPATPTPGSPGLAKAFEDVKTSLKAPSSSLTGAQDRLKKLAASLAEQLEKVQEDSDRYREQLEKTFGDMDRQLTILRSTQSYIEQQVSVWSGNNNR